MHISGDGPAQGLLLAPLSWPKTKTPRLRDWPAQGLGTLSRPSMPAANGEMHVEAVDACRGCTFMYRLFMHVEAVDA